MNSPLGTVGSWIPASVKHLSVVASLPELAACAARGSKILISAPPGSGKTTVIPLWLLFHPPLEQKKIIVVQPRRLAAKTVAERMSSLLDERVGEQVGYSIRFESRTSPATRIEVVTEGILLSRLLTDPELTGVGAIILDEFHERSVALDLTLSLLHEVKDTVRPDLFLLVMSATMGDLSLSPFFTEYQTFSCGSPPYPVTLTYLPQEQGIPLWERTAKVILEVLRTYLSGDLLVFLPGKGEISRTIECVEGKLSHTHRENTALLPLYGDLTTEAQTQVLLPQRKRRVICATNIAETSITIDGVTTVIDTGLHKVMRHDASTLLSQLTTERISRDSADQRSGRAGRTAPGLAFRMWSAAEHVTLRAQREPEILQCDLAAPLLTVAAWGTSPSTFSWITPPLQSGVTLGTESLQKLGAISPSGQITIEGRIMAALGTEPRLARIALEGKRRGAEESAAAIVVSLEGRERSRDTDITSRIESLLSSSSKRPTREVEYWIRRIHAIQVAQLPPVQRDLAVGFLLASGFPERIARRRQEEGHNTAGARTDSLRYLLASGRGATLPAGDPLSKYEYLVVVGITVPSQHYRANSSNDDRILLAAPLDSSLFDTHLKHLLKVECITEFDEHRGEPIRIQRTVIGALPVGDIRRESATPAEHLSAFGAWLSKPSVFDSLPWDADVTGYIDRVMWCRTYGGVPSLPDLSKDLLSNTIAEWLLPFLPQRPKLRDVTSDVLYKALAALVPWNTTQELNKYAPISLTLPNRRDRALSYSRTGSPTLRATVQELLGWTESPKVGHGLTPLTLEILSPARRAIQVTQDLAGFWRGSYSEVRKELRGRYPKHAWPEEPWTALPSRPRRQ